MINLTAFTFSIKEGVAHLTLNRAERGNPIDRSFGDELSEIAMECATNPAVRAVLIDAQGRFFSVGGDLHSIAKNREELPRTLLATTSGLHSAIARFARMNAPVITAVHALAAGGAVGLIAGADFVLASPAAKFYAAFPAIGLAGDSGISYFLPRRMGQTRAKEFLMLNETLDADQAFAAGLVNRVIEPETLQQEAWALAKRLAEGPTRAYGEIKNLLCSGAGESIEVHLENEARALIRGANTEDAFHAMRAVLEKRRPLFNGR